jgi:heme O synthase-like polyprenyltransferase
LPFQPYVPGKYRISGSLIRYEKYRNAGFITISDYLNEKQIKNIVFLWILLTSLLLMLFIGFTEIFGRYFSYLIFILNPVFIVTFSRLLFSQKESYSFRGAFIILNVFGILIMFLLIADSLLAGT